jgi:adenylate cyclase
MGRPQTQIYEFGDFQVDSGKRLLLGAHGRLLPLTPKAFDTLLYLVQHPDAVLEKEMLMKAIWPDTAVEENNLNQSISALRRVLGEKRAEHRYIVTVPGRGYRFVCQVRVAREAQPARRDLAAGASIAVLPFVNLSADADNEYFCDGLAEELINMLSKLGRVRVAARTSAFSFKDKRADVREIGQKLNVSTVLEGSVRKSGGRLRITAQLIDAADGYHVWSERYDRKVKMNDIFNVQDEITLAVVRALKVNLLGEEKSAVLKHHTENTEAYVLYLKGQYYRWKTAPEEFKKCRECFQRAVDLDPSFALGYVGLNSFYGYGSAWGILSPKENWPKAKAALERALELEPLLPEAHLSLAAYMLVCERNWAGAEKEIERVLEWGSSLAEIHHGYSFYLTTQGRFDDAITESRRALAYDPLSITYGRFLGLCLYFARRYDEAVAHYQETIELDPNNALVHESLGDAYEMKGNYREAIAEWQKALTFAGDSDLAGTLGTAFSKSGFASAVRGLARQRLERINKKTESGEYVPAMSRARAYVRLGDLERAFQWLQKACDERNVFPLLFTCDPFYDVLRPDRRFKVLVESIGSVK